MNWRDAAGWLVQPAISLSERKREDRHGRESLHHTQLTGNGPNTPHSTGDPSHFAITTVARQLPSTLTEVRAMSIN